MRVTGAEFTDVLILPRWCRVDGLHLAEDSLQVGTVGRIAVVESRSIDEYQSAVLDQPTQALLFGLPLRVVGSD